MAELRETPYIERLAPDQEARLVEYRDRWIRIGLIGVLATQWDRIGVEYRDRWIRIGLYDRLRWDERGRLHCTDGPALVYPDGWSIWSVGGVLVDEQIVLRPETQTTDQIRGEKNAEVRRVRIERYGWPRYLREVNAAVLDVRDNAIEATRESLMRTPDGETVLVCACPSTARVYALEVPGEVSTCEAAQSWLSGGMSTRTVNGS